MKLIRKAGQKKMQLIYLRHSLGVLYLMAISSYNSNIFSNYSVPSTLRSSLYVLCQSVQFSHSVIYHSLLPMNCSTPGIPVHHQLLALTQAHIYWVGDAIQPSHPLSSPSPPAFNLSQHHGLLWWVSFLHQVAKILEFQIQHQCFQWIFRTDFL